MLATSIPETERLTLYDMSWDGYETLLHVLGDRPVRVTYNQGVLELIILSYDTTVFRQFRAWVRNHLVKD
jgi:hypothetical protein